MSNNCFVATITRVDEGATVTFVNEDAAAHMVTGANFAWGMGADGDEQANELLKGDMFTHAFPDSGVYPYFCMLHPSMVGAVVVGDGLGNGAAQISTNIDALASRAPQGDRGEDAADAIDADDGGSNRTMALGFVGGGVALLFSVVALSKTLSARRASDG